MFVFQVGGLKTFERGLVASEQLSEDAASLGKG